MAAPLIHIGYHKTATTWLQTHLFDSEAAGYVSPVAASTALRAVVGPKDLCFRADDCRAWCDRVGNGGRQGLVPVISCERFSGNPHSGGHDSQQVAARLAALLPGARILIVIREQVAAITSAYYQYVTVGGTLPLAQYLAAPRDFIAPQFNFAHFEYHRLVRVYRELFGADNVRVLTYETFANAPLEFLAELGAFARSEVDPRAAGLALDDRLNVARSGVRSSLQRRVNFIAARRTSINHQALLHGAAATRISAGAVRRAARLVPECADRWHDKALRARVERAVRDRYVASNRMVSALTGLGLAEQGYRV